MTINEARKEKKELEAKIRGLLNEFSERTGLKVTSLDFVRHDLMASSVGYISDVDVEVSV